ncbi:hypothetical protein BGX33_001666, partial [Mortierella sp. NVP41]
MGGHQGFPNCNPNKIGEQLMDIWNGGLRPFFLIDEVSMISGTMQTALSEALQKAAEVDRGFAFGGFPVRMDLLQPCRQATDPGFKSMLDDIRRGELNPVMVSVFLGIWRASKSITDDAVHLLSYKREVADINRQKLRDLPVKS